MNVGETLMAAVAARHQNRRMENERTQVDAADARSRRKSPRVIELQAQIDERDEIIRLLNEALSRALDELTDGRQAA